jgi:AGZA family xanthine/uracil permease-like MFS transporter
MIIDFFDTMGTVTAIGEQAGLTDERGRVPKIGPILAVDSAAAGLGGVFGTSSNTSYIESSAGVGEGGRTGMTSIVTGILFLLAVFLAPLAGIIPAAATAPALIIVGALLFEQVADIDARNLEEAIPALFTMILMPLTFEIAVGIGAGVIAYVFIKVVRGKASEIHPLLWGAAIAFLIFFLQDWIEPLFSGAPVA